MNKLSVLVLIFIMLLAVGLTFSFAVLVVQTEAYPIDIYSVLHPPVPPIATPTQTHTPVLPTRTPSQTKTPVLPTATPTQTNTLVLPTRTPPQANTPILPTTIPTQTNAPVALTRTPTATNMPVRPTTIPTQSNTPVPPTTIPTQTNTPVRPTTIPTQTNTPTPLTTIPAQTNTPGLPTTIPTQTNTPVPPTRTNTPMPSTLTPVGGPGGAWHLKFSDEFTGSSLDTTKWNTCYPEGCFHSGNHELECYMPDDVLLNGGVLRLRAEVRTVTCSNSVIYRYTSGMITSYNKYSLTYGYIEARTRGTAGQGFWPALWTIPADRSWPPELDILEILGNDPTRAYFTYHWGTPATRQQSGFSWAGPDFSAGWHTFGVYWGPNAIRWYVDGVERRTPFTQTGNITSQPMYFIANLAVGGDWPGSPNGSTVFPNYFDLDYVRIWQR